MQHSTEFRAIQLAETSSKFNGSFHYLSLSENQLYKCYSFRPGTKYLQCITRGCPCRAKICNGGFQRTNNEVHNHLLQNHQPAIDFTSAYEKLKNTVRDNPRLSIRSIHLDLTRQFPQHIAARLPWDFCRRTLQRIRNDQMPVCASIDKFVELLEDNEGLVYNSYGVLRDKRFYQGTENGNIFFANMHLIYCLQPDIKIYIDATFSVTPFHTRQLLVILAELQGRPRPLIYVIMQVDFFHIENFKISHFFFCFL